MALKQGFKTDEMENKEEDLQGLQGLIQYDYFIHVLEVQTSNFMCLHELFHLTFKFSQRIDIISFVKLNQPHSQISPSYKCLHA